MLKSLLKIRLASFRRSFVQVGGNKKSVKIVMSVILIYALVSMFFSVGAMYYQLCAPLCSSELSWLYFAVVAISSFNMCLIGSVIAADSMLFEAKDNELLLSMPIPAKYVLASRMSMLLLINYAFIFLFALPAGIVYLMQFPVSAVGAAIFAAAFLALPFLVLPISCFFGWLIALASSKVRRRSLFVLVYYLLIFVACLAIYYTLNSYTFKIISDGQPLADAVKRTLPPFYLLGSAIADKNLKNLLLYLVFAAVPFVLVTALISKNYYKVMMTSRRTLTKEYVEKDVKALSSFWALTKKEISYFLSRPVYMMNAGIGLLIMLVFTIASALKGESMLASMSLPEDLPVSFGIIACAVICLCASTATISAPSVSLEGKCLWIPKSVPVKAEVIFRSKIAAHIFICLPFTVVSGAICSAAFGKGPMDIAVFFLLPFSVVVFCAVLGLAANMKFPKFDWINEAVAIKQSASVLVTIAGSFSTVLLPLFLIIFYGASSGGGLNYLMLSFCAVLFSAAFGLYSLLKKDADKKFKEL